MVLEVDLTLDGGNTMQYIDDTRISYKCMLKTYMILLPNTCNKKIKNNHNKIKRKTKG